MPQSLTNISQIRQHSRQLVREMDLLKSVYLETGCTFSQCHVLFELSTHKALNLIELADKLLLDKSNTSRSVKKLVMQGMIKAEKVSTDNRQKLFGLTAKGEKTLRIATDLANTQVASSLENLSDAQQATVIEGLRLYARALGQSRLQADFQIRKLKKRDNEQVARIIRTVMTEFDAIGEGYSIDDPEVGNMYASYRDKQSCYLVIESDGQIYGGGGIGPLKGGGEKTCELQKMFFLPEIRGIGFGRKLLSRLMDQARDRGYQECYLETLDRMWRANELYLKNGFRQLSRPKGETGHCACDRWYVMDL